LQPVGDVFGKVVEMMVGRVEEPGERLKLLYVEAMKMVAEQANGVSEELRRMGERVGAMSERVKKICGEIMKEMDRMKGVHVNELETKAEEQKSDG